MRKSEVAKRVYHNNYLDYWFSFDILETFDNKEDAIKAELEWLQQESEVE